MAGTKEIKRRIISVKSTKKITKAMELVAASKMKRAISATVASRPYSNYSWEVLEALTQYITESTNPLLVSREIKKILVIVITSNRGLCGGYNSQVVKSTLNLLKQNKDKQIDFISVGKKGEVMLRRFGQNIIASFNDISGAPKLSDVLPIVDFAIKLYKKEEYDNVFVASTFFKSAILQIASTEQILPIEKKEILNTLEEMKNKTEKTKVDYVFEPDYESLMNVIVEKIIRVKFFQMILDSNASEQSSRMLAMKNASDASSEMIDDLTLVFNKARQSNITREISEISAGMASVS